MIYETIYERSGSEEDAAIDSGDVGDDAGDSGSDQDSSWGSRLTGFPSASTEGRQQLQRGVLRRLHGLSGEGDGDERVCSHGECRIW